ncbi:MAG TPA: MEDS domain-containing protein [Microlunatus sp.]|nr:MEDS domain-containing protein [Microlunatus sp.]
MQPSAPRRSFQSYRHEAFLWHDPDDFTAAMVEFVVEGLDGHEPVMVALTFEHMDWLRRGLGAAAAAQVEFVNMAELGRNPARIIPAWRQFVHGQPEPGRPVRGIGEPIWPGRHPQELRECQLHEALLNIAVDPDTPLWLICPYDTGTLDAAVVEEAHRSHPVIVETGTRRGSPLYAGRSHVDTLFAGGLHARPAGVHEAVLTTSNAHQVLSYLKLELFVAGLPLDRSVQLAAATEELALGSLRRGSAQATIRIWSEPDAWICEVVDEMPVADPLIGRGIAADEHEGLWQANQVCDLVQLRSTATGTTVRILAWKQH